jgi:hypothetical protein
MKRFERLHLVEQNQLLIQLLEALGESKCSSIQELSQHRDCSVREAWRDICADTGLDQCEPWDGFPNLPKKLPKPPAGLA